LGFLLSTAKNSNNQDDVYTAVIYGKAIARVYSGHLNERGPASGGRQLIGQAAILILSPPIGCHKPDIYQSHLYFYSTVRPILISRQRRVED